MDIKITSVLLVLGIILLTGCYYDNKEDLFLIDTDCPRENVTYSQTIEPILNNRCYTCHAAGIELGNINLEDFATLKFYVNNTKLIKSIKHESGASAMPQGGAKIPDCEIQKIEKWISDGALDN